MKLTSKIGKCRLSIEKVDDFYLIALDKMVGGDWVERSVKIYDKKALESIEGFIHFIDN